MVYEKTMSKNIGMSYTVGKLRNPSFQSAGGTIMITIMKIIIYIL